MKIKVLSIAILLTVLAVQSCGQQGPGSIYLQINKAYNDKDFQLLLSLYEEGAFYLGPGGTISNNKENFLEPVRILFEQAKEQGVTLAMNHRVVQRDYLGDAALDIGYYKLDKLTADSIINISTGKFMTIARKQSDGSWKFRAEGSSDAPFEAFAGR